MLFSRVDCVAFPRIHWRMLSPGVSRWIKSSVVKVNSDCTLSKATRLHVQNSKLIVVLWHPAGQIALREFLKSEYSEENILFWLACEEYKKIKTVPEMISSANRIYSEFVQTEAPRQVNIRKGLYKDLVPFDFIPFRLNEMKSAC